MEKAKLKILRKRLSPKHEDSFWYDGIIATYGDLKLYAVGETDIRSSKSNFRCNGFSSWDEGNAFENNLCDPRKSNDKTLEKIGSDYTDHYYWDANNWFEIIDDSENSGCNGEIEYNYTEAIKMLKNAYKNKNKK